MLSVEEFAATKRCLGTRVVLCDGMVNLPEDDHEGRRGWHPRSRNWNNF